MHYDDYFSTFTLFDQKSHQIYERKKNHVTNPDTTKLCNNVGQLHNCLTINHTVLIGCFNLPTTFKYQKQKLRNVWIDY